MVGEPSELNDSTKYYGIETGQRYPKGAQPAQVIGSHDVPRAWQYTANEPWRHRNAALLAMTLRGTPFVYYGEELGMQPGSQVVVDDRDASRTPMTWTAADAGHGFTKGIPWIAFGSAPEQTAVDVEDADPKSMLTYYRQLLAFRRGHAVWGTGEVRLVALDVSAVVAFLREDATQKVPVVVNLSDENQEGVATDALPGTTADIIFEEGTADLSGGAVRVKMPAKAAVVFQVR